MSTILTKLWKSLRICSCVSARPLQYSPCPQNNEVSGLPDKKIDKYTFAITVHFPAKSYINRMKFDKVEGKMFFSRKVKGKLDES